MAMTAENLAAQKEISREEADEFALRSHETYANALKEGYFEKEMSSILLKDRKGNETPFNADECPRADTTMESLGRLPTVFKKDGVISAGNASAITDGAAALVVSSEEGAAAKGIKPLARIVSWGIVGVDPSIMGIGPVGAIRQALERAELSLDDMSLIEINEAFAPQYLACERELGLNREITNVNGGAIAIGHPLAASGARITAHLCYELQRRGGKYAIGSACIGGGQGIAILIENPDH
jgi:acetyl-CoA acetyltransferase family protein